MDHDEYHPDPEPYGALVPPSRHPPTALGVATPPPPRPPRSLPSRSRRTGLGRLLALVVDGALDMADRVGDSIADTVGMRGRGRHGH